MSVLREIGEQNVRGKVPYATMEEATRTLDDPVINGLENDGLPLRDLLSGRVWVTRYGDSSHLEVIIHQIYFFIEEQRENWTRNKRRYKRTERRFGRSLLSAIRDIHKNLVWDLAVKPPADRTTFLRLMVCCSFDPIFSQWTVQQMRTAKNRLDAIRRYYDVFNQQSQDEMREKLDAQDRLLVV